MKYDVGNYSNQLCPDELFGTITVSPNSSRNPFFPNKGPRVTDANVLKKPFTGIVSSMLCTPANARIIILVLESPHSSEFQKDGTPICPANGETGKRIDNYLDNSLSNTVNNGVVPLSGNYDVYLVNAIQRQCSLGISPINRLITESNFIDEWRSNNQNLSGRINNIVSNSQAAEILFINCCTKGDYLPLRAMVTLELKTIAQSYNAVVVLEGNHPLSWNMQTSFVRV